MPGILLDAEAVRAATAGGLWTSVEVVESTGSTNADLLARGGPEGQVLLAEEQTAGRGRLGRSWVSEPGASLTFSVLLRPVTVPADRRGWLALLAGLAVVEAVRSVSGVPAALKWPNDVLADHGKLAGILAEQSADGDAVVMGVGLNVSTAPGALPSGASGASGPSGVSGASGPSGASGASGLPPTSLAIEGADVSREALFVEVLRRLDHWYSMFRDSPDAVRGGLLAAYRSRCATLGRHVRVELPGGQVLDGTAEDIDTAGHLLVRAGGAADLIAVSAGDVIHVR